MRERKKKYAHTHKIEIKKPQNKTKGEKKTERQKSPYKEMQFTANAMVKN